MKRIQLLKNATILFTFLLVVWGCYRLIFKLPDILEEVLIKPLVWIIPVFYFVRNERKNLESIGITFRNLFQSVYAALALGSFFVIIAVLSNYIKYGKLNFGANLGAESILVSFLVSFATAISEEIVFRGYIFNRLWEGLGSEVRANIITSIGWTIIHIPITVFVNKLDLLSAVVYLTLTFIFGVGSAFLYARTKNVASSILLHVLWEWPIMLFR